MCLDIVSSFVSILLFVMNINVSIEFIELLWVTLCEVYGKVSLVFSVYFPHLFSLHKPLFRIMAASVMGVPYSGYLKNLPFQWQIFLLCCNGSCLYMSYKLALARHVQRQRRQNAFRRGCVRAESEMRSRIRNFSTELWTATIQECQASSDAFLRECREHIPETRHYVFPR